MTRQDYNPNLYLLWGSREWVQRRDLQGPDPQGPDEDYWFSNQLLVYRKPGQNWTCKHRDPGDQYLEAQGTTPYQALETLLGAPIEVLGHPYYPITPKGDQGDRGFRNLLAPLQFQYLVQSQSGSWGMLSEMSRYPTAEQALGDFHTRWLASTLDLEARQATRVMENLQALMDNRARRLQADKWFSK